MTDFSTTKWLAIKCLDCGSRKSLLTDKHHRFICRKCHIKNELIEVDYHGRRISTRKTTKDEVQSVSQTCLLNFIVENEKGDGLRESGSTEVSAGTSQSAPGREKFNEYLKTFSLIAFSKKDPEKKVLYKYITKHRLKFFNAETGEIKEMHQFSFFKLYTAQKKTNRNNKKRRFINFGKKRVA